MLLFSPSHLLSEIFTIGFVIEGPNPFFVEEKNKLHPTKNKPHKFFTTVKTYTTK